MHNEAVETDHTAFMMQEDFHMGDTFRIKLANIPAGSKIDLVCKCFFPLYLREVDISLDRFKALNKPFVSLFSMPGKIGAQCGNLMSQMLIISCLLPCIFLNLLFMLCHCTRN